MMRTPRTVRLREEAAARCRKIERRVLRKQARKARAELGEVQLGASEEQGEEKAADIIVR